MVKLVKPSTKYKKSFLKAYEEVGKAPRVPGMKLALLEKDFGAFVKSLDNLTKGIDVQPGFVPETTLWLIDNDEYAGGISIRHKLTDKLKEYGGHIGYSIRPSKRGKGYGTKMLELALPHAKKLGLEKALITCDMDNTASRKMIIASGGILQDTIETDLNPDKKPTMRWWVDLR